MLKKLKKRRDEGFTLIELLIVVIILAILAAIVVFAVGTTATNAKVSACNADAKSVETALESYKAQVGTYPAALNDLIAGTTDSGGNEVGSWMRAVPSATVGADGYAITYDGAGGVDVTTTGGTSNYDTAATNPCNAA